MKLVVSKIPSRCFKTAVNLHLTINLHFTAIHKYEKLKLTSRPIKRKKNVD